ncbi:MAG: hypothetical protein RLZZ53_1235 [Acidobacteriota bacterium]
MIRAVQPKTRPRPRGGGALVLGALAERFVARRSDEEHCNVGLEFLAAPLDRKSRENSLKMPSDSRLALAGR